MNKKVWIGLLGALLIGVLVAGCGQVSGGGPKGNVEGYAYAADYEEGLFIIDLLVD